MVWSRPQSQVQNGQSFRGGHDEDFPVAHPAGAGGGRDSVDDLINPAIVDPQLDFDLGQKSQRVLAVTILVEVALLPSKTLDLANRAGLDRGEPQRLEHLLGEKRPHDGNDLFHQQ